jgi:XTP/dITP diphosphohydrolase
VTGQDEQDQDRAGRVAPQATAPVRGTRLLELVQIMDTLRLNCPWDARQTHASLAPYLLEETYETVDALASGDQAAVREELGDVLLQVVFHARVAEERTDGTGYDIDDVADGIISKLTRRHPHVFGDLTVSGPDEVTVNWDSIKAAERAAARGAGGPGEPGPPSALDGVPLSQPALSLAAQLLRRAERVGVPAELADLAPEAPGVSDIGQELFALVNRARAEGLDPELELRAAARAYADRVRSWEAGQASPPR